MISHISIENFAIIRSLSLDLSDGLNIITGETGAGKSIIIEAISMALGSRADTDYVRNGEDKALISMVVDWDGDRIRSILAEEGIPDDNPMVIKREIGLQSKSICRINGSIVPLSVLSRLCRLIADIHGQYDHQSLLDPDNHINILDLYGGDMIRKLLEKVSSAYADYIEASTELMKLRRTLNDSDREKELLEHEYKEIEAAGIRVGEAAELEEKISIIENSENIFKALSNAYDALFGGMSADEALSRAMNELNSVSEFSQDIADASKVVSEAYYQIDDLAGTLRKLKDKTSYSEEELNECIERLDLINNLKRKFGGSEQSVIDYMNKALDTLNSIENSDAKVKELETKITKTREKYDTLAEELTRERIDAAEILEDSINYELAELNFLNARFSVKFEPSSVSAKGSDKIEFLISANKGEPLRPLSKVASGGELSRIMLAMKRIIGEIDEIPTMIFDEIDTGISGATAGIVGNKLKSISKDHQIVCITHLPQIACLGDHHYKIEKTSDEISTETTVVPLSEEERVEELARLLSGTNITDAARQQAKELLKG